ncbi:Meiotic recombination protein SPO11 [Lonchura striata]|uniref:Meiotic recombination protein SPO11 n=1 Tax=Lonchura striata TaxID=40157 RepID=A0A218UZM8_9PASE|nr:Meiotic recombination protein SPO11 [Lonchura striata domestica]
MFHSDVSLMLKILSMIYKMVQSNTYATKRQSLCHLMFKELKGRGVPDLNTRLLVRKLWDSFQIPIFTLMDADPHGVEIMCVYKYGSVLEIMAASKLKAEIQVLTSVSPDYLSRVYLPNKLQFGGWL